MTFCVTFCLRHQISHPRPVVITCNSCDERGLKRRSETAQGGWTGLGAAGRLDQLFRRPMGDPGRVLYHHVCRWHCRRFYCRSDAVRRRHLRQRGCRQHAVLRYARTGTSCCHLFGVGRAPGGVYGVYTCGWSGVQLNATRALLHNAQPSLIKDAFSFTLISDLSWARTPDHNGSPAA